MWCWFHCILEKRVGVRAICAPLCMWKISLAFLLPNIMHLWYLVHLRLSTFKLWANTESEITVVTAWECEGSRSRIRICAPAGRSASCAAAVLCEPCHSVSPLELITNHIPYISEERTWSIMTQIFTATWWSGPSIWVSILSNPLVNWVTSTLESWDSRSLAFNGLLVQEKKF